MHWVCRRKSPPRNQPILEWHRQRRNRVYSTEQGPKSDEDRREDDKIEITTIEREVK